MIFTLPHEGADRLFTCGGDTEEGMIYFGASPDPDLVDRLCRNEAPLIDGYRTGPFFRLVWGTARPVRRRSPRSTPFRRRCFRTPMSSSSTLRKKSRRDRPHEQEDDRR